MMMLTEEILPAYTAYLDAKAKMDEAKKIMDTAKAKIIKFHKDNGIYSIKDRGLTSTLVEGCRETLLKDVIEEKFGKLPPECIKTTNYETLRISGSLING